MPVATSARNTRTIIVSNVRRVAAAVRTSAGRWRKPHSEARVFGPVEQQVRVAVEWLRLIVETLGALVIAAGLLVAIAGLLRQFLARGEQNFQSVRLFFARYLTLALELQLAADILSTSIAPDWNQIGKLGAIAVIRTALNYFLNREMRGEEGRAEADFRSRTDPG